MTNDKGLIKASTPGVSECYATDVTLMILGKAAHATYQSNKEWGHVDDDDFGTFTPNSLKLNLDVYIDTLDRETDLHEDLASYTDQVIDYLDYGYHAKSDIWQVRALVAMNGECLELLSKDPHASVRQKVVESVLYQHENSDGFKGTVDFSCKTDEQEFLMFKRFVPISVNLGDISYIDDMINDEDEGVRYTIARMGITRHIDALLDDPSPYVKMAIAYKGQERHLEHLINDDSPDVLRLIVCNQNATQQQMQAIAHRVKYTAVLEALMERGIFHEFFIDEPVADWVKSIAAIKGYSHERLSEDDFSPVREMVAEYTMDIDILNRLLDDEDPEVVQAARHRIVDLNKCAGL